MSSLVQTEDAGRVRHIVLDRPDKRNAFNGELIADLHAAVRATAAAPDVHAVVLRGNGPMFSSGVDLKELAAQQGLDPALLPGAVLAEAGDEHRHPAGPGDLLDLAGRNLAARPPAV